jgi:hypothetical protein
MHYGVFALLLFRKKKILSVVEKLKPSEQKYFLLKNSERNKSRKKKKHVR